jgi:hypothetical protein
MGRRASSGKKVDLKRSGSGAHCRAGWKCRGKVLKACLQRLIASHAKSPIPLQTGFFFIDIREKVPDSPQIGKPEFTCVVKELSVGQLCRGIQRGSLFLVEGDGPCHDIPAHRQGTFVFLKSRHRLVGRPDLKKGMPLQLEEVEAYRWT